MTPEDEDIDRTIVLEGLPRKAGWWLIWHHQSGWPWATPIVVEENQDGPIWFVGTAGTDRHYEVTRLVGAWSHLNIIGYSAISSEAFAYLQAEWDKTKVVVRELLAERDNGDSVEGEVEELIEAGGA